MHRFDIKTIKTFELGGKTTIVIKLQWIASISLQNDQKRWVTSQNIQNNAKLQNWSNNNALHGFDVKTIKNVELRRKTFKTTQNYKSNQITMNCNDLTSKLSKILSYVAKHSKQRKTTKWSNYNELHRFDVETIKNAELRLKTFKTTLNFQSNQITMNCIDLTSNHLKCWVTSQNIQNNAKLQNWSNYNELHWFDVRTIKNVELRR